MEQNPIFNPPPYGNLSTTQEVPVVTKVSHLYLDFHNTLSRFPKVERYSLGETVQQEILLILKLSIAAGAEDRTKKPEILKKALTAVDMLKILIRLCNETDSIKDVVYIQLQGQLQEIGRMLGGWLKSVN